MLNIGRNIIKFSQNIILNSSLNVQQIRETHILKRRWPPNLTKKGFRPKRLKVKTFVYDQLGDTDSNKKPDLQVLLTAYVEGLGQRGDIVSVRPNFAYIKLLLPGLGVYPTPENKEKYSRDNLGESEVRHSSPFAERTVNVLSGISCSVVMNLEEPWTLEPWHVRVSLRKAGIHISDDSVLTLPEGEIKGPDLSLENKEFLVTVTINNLEKVDVRCRIHHWSTQPSDRLPYQVEPWCKPAEPLFPEQAEKLQSKPLPQSKIPEAEIPQLF